MRTPSRPGPPVPALLLVLCLLPSVAAPATVTVDGYVKAEAIYDLDRVNPDWNSVLRPSQILVPRPGASYRGDGELVFSLRASRVGMTATSAAHDRPVTARLEIDFYGVGANAGQQVPRLRHAYVTWSRLLVGQTWSLFHDPGAWPATLDFWGPCGMMATRRPQLRWTPATGDGLAAAVALEQPGAGIDAGKGPQYDPDLDVRPHSRAPDATARVRLGRDARHLQLAGVARALTFEGSRVAGADTLTIENTKFGWGLSLSGRLGRDAGGGLTGSLTYGEGIANYGNDGGVDMAPDAAIRPVVLPLLGWHLAYDHAWNRRWASSVGYSRMWQENSDGQHDDAFGSGAYAHANLVHAPRERLSYGVELLWGRLVEKDGRRGEDRRVHMAVTYVF